MNWLEVSLSVDTSVADAVAEVFSVYSYGGVALEQEDIPPEAWDDGYALPPVKQTVRGYLPLDEHTESVKLKLEDDLAAMALPTPAYSSVAEADWAEAWKAHYKPLRIGKRILVRPLWIEANLQPGDIEIALDPGMAFGTGTHATTQLCLQALEDRLSPGMTVLDLGTGSGILAIAAAKLGAAHVYAIDNDPVATEAAAGNFAQNGANEAVTIATGSLADALGSGTAYDFVVVNILARIILGMTGDGLERVVKPGGIAVFSGIIQPQADEVEAALRAIGLKPTARRQRDDWVLIETTRV